MWKTPDSIIKTQYKACFQVSAADPKEETELENNGHSIQQEFFQTEDRFRKGIIAEVLDVMWDVKRKALRYKNWNKRLLGTEK